MTEGPTFAYTPLEVPLPPGPDASFFSESQWRTLFVIANTIVPSIRTGPTGSSAVDKVISTQQWTSVVNKLSALVPTSEGTEIAVLYLEEDVSSNPAFQACVQRLLGHYVHDEGRRGIGFILNALNTQAGSLFLTGSTKLFHQQPIAFREKVFQGWASSRLPSLRKAYRGLSAIMKKSWVLSSGTLNHVLGFPPIPIPLKPTNGFPYTFLQFPAGDEPEVVETDVVIIGSGCGGAVAAKNLGEAGLRVIVVEKSYCYSSKSFPMAQNEAYINMFENAGAIMSEDGTVAIMAGSTWGGGGTVNWSACLQTQAHVRKEWANTGLSLFTSLEFQRSLDRVCDRMGVNTDHVKHNCQNDIILEGAHKLGYAAKSVPQNTGNSEHYCGHCTLGCQSAGKKGPTETFLADAAKAEAVFIEGFTANKVLFKMDTKNGKRVPVGVEGIWTSRDAYHGVVGDGAVKRRLIIHAKKVVLSSGTLQSPLLLLRSGIKNPEIGKNLYLHPVMICGAVFDHEIRPWEGSALTTVVNEFENLDGHGHGVKIEAAAMMPSIYIPVFPWRDGLDYKLWAAGMGRSTSFITLTKDRDSGRVFPDPMDGRPRIDYTVSTFDRHHMVEGIIAAAKIAYISGAKEFHTTYRDFPPFIRPDFSSSDASEGVNDNALQGWIANLRQRSHLNVECALFASAHQMGTCRMGKDPRLSVVGPECQVWGTDGLYVLDASVFPSASGVNPMVTIMAIADWASLNLARKMGKSGCKLKNAARL